MVHAVVNGRTVECLVNDSFDRLLTVVGYWQCWLFNERQLLVIDSYSTSFDNASCWLVMVDRRRSWCESWMNS